MKTNSLHRPERSGAYKIAAWSAVLLMLYSLATILIVAFIGGPPSTVQECFSMLAENRLHGFLRLDVLTVFIMPLYYVLFYGLYVALRGIDSTMVTISTILIFAGVTVFLAQPSVFSYVRLSDAYHAATSETEKNRLWAAAEAILSTDIWNGTGGRISGLMVQTGAVALSVAMLRSAGFSRLTAWTGIVTHGLDLVHIIVGFFSIAVANTIMVAGGLLYLLWFPLITVALLRLARKNYMLPGSTA